MTGMTGIIRLFLKLIVQVPSLNSKPMHMVSNTLLQALLMTFAVFNSSPPEDATLCCCCDYTTSSMLKCWHCIHVGALCYVTQHHHNSRITQRPWKLDTKDTAVI